MTDELVIRGACGNCGTWGDHGVYKVVTGAGESLVLACDQKCAQMYQWIERKSVKEEEVERAY